MEIHFNNPEIEQTYNSFIEKTKPPLIQILKKHIDIQQNMLDKLENTIKENSTFLDQKPDKSLLTEKLKKYKRDLLDILTTTGQELKDQTLDEIPLTLDSIALKVEKEIPEKIEIKEKLERYTPEKSDNLVLRLKKTALNLSITTRYKTRKISNKIRKILKNNQPDPDIFHIRKINFREMTHHYLTTVMTNHLLDEYSIMKKSGSIQMTEWWHFDDELDKLVQEFLLDESEKITLNPALTDRFKELKTKQNLENTTALEKLPITLSALIINVFTEFDKAVDKVGKADLPYKNFSPTRLKKRKIESVKNFNQTADNWRNSHLALIDDWAIDIEVTLLFYTTLNTCNQLKSNVKNYISTVLDPLFSEIETYIIRSRATIEQSDTTLRKLRNALNLERKKVQNELNAQLISTAIEKLSGCFTDDIEMLSATTFQQVKTLSDKRALIRNKNYNRPIKKQEINYISPRELLHFEALPNFDKRLKALNSSTEAKLEKARLNLISTGTVSDFNIESALMLIDQKKDNIAEAVNIITEGFCRAIRHLETVKEIVTEIRKNISEDSKNAVLQFNNEIQKLKNTDNIFDLQLKIARINAIEKSKKIRQEAIRRFHEFLPEMVKRITNIDTYFRNKIRKYRIRFGFITLQKFVTFELIEFIDQTNQTLNRLPFVYQRLYQLRPTDEERFFVNRLDELEQLSQAYDNWKRNRFITTAIIGEKGSGITSLINYFLKNKVIDTKIIKHTLSEKIYTPEKYFAFFSQLFGKKDFKSNQEIIDQINAADEEIIVVLENLQHLFLKRVNGFTCLHMFFELITTTMKKALWICSFTNHTWNYLDKTINISGYFTVEITLKPLKKEVIEEIIFKRNRLSGYKIVFEPDNNTIENRAFQKLTDEGKQDFLRKQFFKILRKLSGGNISLAQMYWLRSTVDVSAQNITIGAGFEMDFSFIKSLSDNDLFILQTMVLHDGLTLEDFALVTEKSPSECRNMLIPMFEMGILIRPHKKYTINPVIYKTITDNLSSKNFIH